MTDGMIFAEPRITARDLAGGARLFYSEVPLGPHAPSVAALLRAGADAHPDRPLVGQRDAAGEWHLASVLAELNVGAGSASIVDGLLLMARPADLDAGEITDKGYVNQRRVLALRTELVELLYAEPRSGHVITPGRSGTVTTLNS